ncbi:MAG: hypothetical protein IKV45_00255 [Firmicutes bacterium]|nr:hypothetical protein [Bacillota bacterium]
MPSKIHAPFIDHGAVLCSRCFSQLGDIEKYGCDENGTWFMASCRSCKSKMRWYRNADGSASSNEKQTEDNENSFSFHMENGEIVMKSE